MKKTILAAGAAVLALGSVAYAAPGMWGDETVTLPQAQAKAATMFQKMDANSDGQLNEADREARHAAHFAELDADSNGAISREEFAARRAKDGERMRGSGRDQAQRSADGEGRMSRDGKRGQRGKGGHGGGMRMAQMADTNKDGTVTRAEFDSAVAGHFRQMDSDGDGSVTAAERKAARDAMREQMKQARASGNAG